MSLTKACALQATWQVCRGKYETSKRGFSDVLTWRESTEALRAVLDDLISRGLRQPAFLIVDGAPGLELGWAARRDEGILS